MLDGRWCMMAPLSAQWVVTGDEKLHDAGELLASRAGATNSVGRNLGKCADLRPAAKASQICPPAATKENTKCSYDRKT